MTAGRCHTIQVAAADNSALRVVASRSHRDQATDDYIRELRGRRVSQRRLITQILLDRKRRS